MTSFSSKMIPAVILAALAATSTSVLAQDAPPPRPDFAALDGNKDGQITKAEAEAYHTAEIAAMDTNKDGKISAEELAAFHIAKMKENMEARAKDHAEHMIADLDSDKDGSLSLAEMAARKGEDRMFDRVDTNSDGVLSAEEIAAAKTFMDRNDHRGGRHGGGHGFWGMFGQ